MESTSSRVGELYAASREIPGPAAESAGLRDDALEIFV